MEITERGGKTLKSKIVSRKRIWIIVIAFLLLVGVSILWLGNDNSEKLILHLAFDENSGSEVIDSTGKNKNAEVHYIYNHAVYMENREPEWRSTGVEGGSLLFCG